MSYKVSVANALTSLRGRWSSSFSHLATDHLITEYEILGSIIVYLGCRSPAIIFCEHNSQIFGHNGLPTSQLYIWLSFQVSHVTM